MRRVSILLASMLMVIMVWGGLAATEDLTGNDILARMEDSFSGSGDSSGGGIILTLSLQNEFANGVTSQSDFTVFGRTVIDRNKGEDADETTYALMVFLTGDDEGAIFLTMNPEDEREKARMWLYLPALGMTKELVSEEEQGMSFAGSTMSYGDIGGSTRFVDNYTAEIASEEALTIGDTQRNVWVLHLSERADARDDVDYPAMSLWIDKEEDVALRMQGLNEQGTIEMEMESLALGTFEGSLTIDQLVSRNVLEGTSSTVTFHGRQRPDRELSLSIFDPDTLKDFGPSEYGF